jgi:hypothetical protein
MKDIEQHLQHFVYSYLYFHQKPPLSVIFFAFLKTVGPIEIQTDVVLYNLHLKLCQSNPPSIQEDHGD